MEVKYKRADELDCGDVIINDGMETVVESVEVVSGYIRINKKEVLKPPEAQLRLVYRSPSDLEIVQKALIKSGLCLRSNNFGFDVFIYYHQDGLEFIKEMISLTDLLTWAKQTVGYE